MRRAAVKFFLMAVAVVAFIACVPLSARAALEDGDDFDAMKAPVDKPEEIPESSQGDAEYNLGVKYYNVGNARVATGWFRKAAEHGEVEGQSHLGFAYEFGLGTAKNYAEALKWYGLAAAQNDKDARCGLGRLYAKGQGVKRDDTVAAKWLRLAADQGQPDAQYGLGLFYHSGRGVKKDDGEAYFWWALSSKTYDLAMKKRDAVAKHLDAAELQALRLRLMQWKAVE